jgi:hypothetical protein
VEGYVSTQESLTPGISSFHLELWFCFCWHQFLLLEGASLDPGGMPSISEIGRSLIKILLNVFRG